MLDAEDTEILDLARAGHRQEAVSCMVERHGGRLAAACRRLTGNAADAEDVLQDVWVHIDRGLAGFRGDADLYTWAFRIALNLTLNRRRGLAARATHIPLDEGPLAAGPGDGGDPDGSCATTFRAWVVERALLSLPASQRLALTLHDLEEMTAPETATALGIAVTAVKARVHRARKALRERIAAEYARRGVEIDAVETIGCVSGLFETDRAAASVSR